MTPRLQEKEGFAALALRMRANGIDNSKLMAAIEKCPRHLFAPALSISSVYSNFQLPIECGSSMESIDMATRLIHELQVEDTHRILELGTGSGFTAAVLGALCERVITVDRYFTLVRLAQQKMELLNIHNVMIKQADGLSDLQSEGVFDRILATAAFPEIPRKYVDRLTTGGQMVCAIGKAGEQQMLTRLTKIGNRFEKEPLFPVRFQPLIPAMAVAI